MKILLVIALIITGGLSAAAQERVLTEAEFNEAVRRAERSLHDGTYGSVRQLLETAVTTEGRPETDYRLKSIALVVPGQATHRIEDRTVGGRPSKTESLTVGDRKFDRNADGAWKELAVGPRADKQPEKDPAIDPQAIDREAVYKYIGTETFADREVHVYTKSERRKTFNTATGSTNESEAIVKVRIGSDGKYYRNESDTKNLVNGRTGQVKILFEVYADPNIKITAPEISK